MSFSRRGFLQTSGGAAAALLLGVARSGNAGSRVASGVAPEAPMLRADSLAKFVDPLPLLARAKPVGLRNTPKAGTPLYRVGLGQVLQRVHRDLPPTSFWSFGPNFPGPMFDVRRGEGIAVEWTNRLPDRHFLPIDQNIHGAEEGLPEARAVVHLHGAKVGPESDGNPERWLTPGQSATYYYPNDQDAATLWYHDHTMGINRLNVYAGLMGVYLVRDDEEDALNLPKGRFEVPLLICDRQLRVDGQLDYPTSGDPDAPWVDDATGDAYLINGKLFPYLDVDARKYRFRIVNASNGRFLRLTISGSGHVRQIGTDQGLLRGPVDVDAVRLAPGERADIVVDFAERRGERVVLENDGFEIAQFRVSDRVVADTSSVPAALRSITPLREADATETRTHTLGQEDDMLARPMRMLLNGARWHMPVTEHALIGSTEIWNLVNTTDESHPIHLHLVRFQILDRRKFDPFAYQSQSRLVFTGPSLPPAPAEAGWKDTVRAEAGMATRIIVRFDGYVGRYMWHCHILEHGDNEMMRPFEVVAPQTRRAGL